MTVESNHGLGCQFFASQDRLRGGADSELCTAAYTAQIGSNPLMSWAEHEQFAKLFYAAFPDLSHTIDETIADHDRVVVRFTLRGTHTSNFMGIAATNKTINVPAIAILRILDGRVNELYAIFDQSGLMQQLSS